uniref:Uncharacterized protein n=1 Tax=Trichogramma kaykai TaxID=54128 RepID=A0ABD2WPD3_9HYME
MERRAEQRSRRTKELSQPITPHHRRVHRQNCAQAESDSGSADGFSRARCSRGIASRRRSTSFFAERYSIRSRSSVTRMKRQLQYNNVSVLTYAARESVACSSEILLLDMKI